MPETIGFIILEAAGIGGASSFTLFGIQGGLTLGAVVGSAVLAGGAVALNALLANQPTDAPQDGQIVVRQALPWRRRSYGEVMLAGPLMFSETRAGKRYQMVALNHGEIDSIIEYRLSELVAVLGLGGFVTNGYAIGGVPHVQLDAQLGAAGEAANGILTVAFPDIWTEDHLLAGVAKLVMVTAQPQAKDFTKVYPGGQPPAPRVLARTSKVWDPRSGSQNKDDRNTWTFSRNAVLHALDYIRHADGMGLAPFDDILFTPAALTEDWIPCANICDEPFVAADGSSNPRYSCAGGYQLNSPPRDVLQSMMSTCDGQLYQRPDGALGIRVGKTIVPTVTITDDHIKSYRMRRGPAARLQPVNQVLAKYTAPSLDYQEADAAAWRDEDAITETGREETQSLDLRWCYDHNQVRRLMKLAFHRLNPEWAGEIVTDLDGVRAYNERYIRVQIAEIALDATFEVGQSFELDPATMTCRIPISSITQAAFDFDSATEEGGQPSVPDEIDPGEEIDPPENFIAPDSSDGFITMSWDPATRGDATPQAQYAVADSEAWQEAVVDGDQEGAITPALGNGDYDVRVRFVVGSRASDWVTIEDVTVS